MQTFIKTSTAADQISNGGRSRRQAIIGEFYFDRRWPNARVPYVISDDYGNPISYFFLFLNTHFHLNTLYV